MRRGWLLLALGGAAVACEVDRAEATLATVSSPPTPTIATVAPPSPELATTSQKCSAPSLAASAPLDARDAAALSRCVPPSTGQGRVARLCGQEQDLTEIDHERLRRAVRPLDAATLTHIRSVAKKGAAEGRRADVFGLVGDSMTVSGAFLRATPRALDPAIAESLRLRDGSSVIDFYAQAQAARVRGAWRNSFGAPRAAKVGARAPWALEGGGGSPVSTMVKQLSPAVAVVLFGGNDAAYGSHLPLAELEAQFEEDLEAIITALEARGVIPILNTLARHGSAPGFEDCSAGRELTNWRITVQTNALSARVVDIACRHHLPLIDVRDALDAAVNLGLGPDQIHPSGYEKGPEILDRRGLRCGYNVRNYVTLLMLKQIQELVFDADATGNRSAKQ